MKTFEEMSEEERAQIAKLAAALENQPKAADWLAACRADRDSAINELRALGWIVEDCAAISGLSPAAVSKIGKGKVVATHGAKLVST